MKQNELIELDAWIAEYVMGWRAVQMNIDEPIGYPPHSVEGFEYELIPAYTTDPAAAMEVLGRCAEKTSVSIRRQVNTEDKRWCVWHHPFCDDSGEETFETFADTLELAICQFAKKLFSK